MRKKMIGALALFMVWAFCSTVEAQNVAKGKIATQSSIYSGYGADFGVDGEKGQFTHTSSELNAWWQVDLGASYNIRSIKIWNRIDCCGERLSDFYIFVSDIPFNTTDINQLKQSSTYVYNSGQMGESKQFNINAKGRYVRVELSGTNYLSLNEVEVESGGSVSTTPTNTATISTVVQGTSGGQNVALNKPAKQSTDYTVDPNDPTGKAYLAVDGAIDPQTGVPAGSWFGNQVTHTNLEKSPWWQVDLGASYDIGSVTIWNRTDCCGERLSDYYIVLSEEPFNEISSLDQILSQSGASGRNKAYYINGPNGVSNGFIVRQRARYVRIQLKGENYLCLAEVQVFSGSGNTTPTGSTTSTSTIPGSTIAGPIDLTGVWLDNNGGTYAIRQIDNQIWWYMDHKPVWTNVLKGNLSGNTITGEWCDVPGGKLEGKTTGSLILKVVNNNRLEKISAYPFPYGGSVWTR